MRMVQATHNRISILAIEIGPQKRRFPVHHGADRIFLAIFESPGDAMCPDVATTLRFLPLAARNISRNLRRTVLECRNRFGSLSITSPAFARKLSDIQLPKGSFLLLYISASIHILLD